MKNSLIITGLGLTIIGISLIIAYRNKIDSKHKEIKDMHNINDINPQSFNVGYINNSFHKEANLCKNDYENEKNNPRFFNVRYPINPVYVDYGESKISENCSCTEFIRSP